MITTPHPVVKAMQSRYHEWIAEPLTGAKYVYFESLLKHECGLDVIFSDGATYTKEIVDEEKYTLFLLRYA